ncbi:carbohydrate sulfotransferase 13-like [Amphibalanus amphitrite]|uniref:carbohydrate sulfotransferase 13-like n=1 Tax=Amphibalanus amphitrite TaxID=1232801 RepID=UPI001C8FD396|nr:carbohydrate sulfotransferase 13-like [Amphibalanus amphitrite]
MMSYPRKTTFSRALLLLSALLMLSIITSLGRRGETLKSLPEISKTSEQFSAVAEADMMAQQYRRELLEKRCISTKSLKTFDYLIERPWLLRWLIYNDEHRLMYCYVPKVSCTQWKKLFGILSGVFPNVPFNSINSGHAHEPNLFPSLAQLPEPEIRRRLETYTSFMFTRHPLERMASAYRDKLSPGNTVYRQQYAAKIMGQPNGSISIHNRQNTSLPLDELPTVTFDKFAEWIVRAGPVDLDTNSKKAQHDEHWRPMVDLCHPCTIPYTVLGRTATLAEDARLVLRTANITSVKFPEGYRSATPGVTESLVSLLRTDVLKGVLRHYLHDLFLFGYRPQAVFHENATARDITQNMYEELLAEAMMPHT